MNKWGKLRALRWRERLLLSQAALMLPATALGVRILDVKRCQNAMAQMIQKEENAAHNADAKAFNSSSKLETQATEIREARNIARLVRAAANHGIYRANCLEQSLVLWCLLKRNGFESEIRFGARKEKDQLHAHAWVECLGMTLNEDRSVEQRFAPFAGVTAGTRTETR